MSAFTKYLRQNALTVTLLLACCAIGIGLFHDNVRRIAAPVATLPVVSADGDGIPLVASDDVLSRVIPELNVENRPTLETLIQVIADTAPCNISVNWRNLETAGVSPDTVVAGAYGPFRNITVRQALSQLWKDKDASIGYSVRDNVILIDTQDNLAKNTITLVYNVRDLIAAMINSKEYVTDRESADALTTLLTDSINSDSWRDNGGNVGSVREMMGLLIITQTPDNHRKIEALLDLLRRSEFLRRPTPIPADLAAALHMPLTQPVEIETAATTESDELQIYDVRDLIKLMARQPDFVRDPNYPDESPRGMAVREITETLESTVAPETWGANGGSPGIVHEVMGLLIVRQSNANQKAVKEVLQAMRTALQSLGAKN